MFLLFSVVLYFPHNYHILWSWKKKGNRCDLKNINYSKVNSNFFLSVSKVCASLICSGGICQGAGRVYVLGDICPRGYMS